MVSESAFWISDVLTFLEVPEDLRAALSTQRLIRLNELQHPDKSATESVAIRQPVRTSAAASVAEAPMVFPLLPSATPQVRTICECQNVSKETRPPRTLTNATVKLLGRFLLARLVQGATQRWLPTVVSRSEASEGQATMGPLCCA